MSEHERRADLENEHRLTKLEAGLIDLRTVVVVMEENLSKQLSNVSVQVSGITTRQDRQNGTLEEHFRSDTAQFTAHDRKHLADESFRAGQQALRSSDKAWLLGLATLVGSIVGLIMKFA